MRVVIKNKTSSTPLIFEDVLNTYSKGGFFCLVERDKTQEYILKIPLSDIYYVKEILQCQ